MHPDSFWSHEAASMLIDTIQTIYDEEASKYSNIRSLRKASIRIPKSSSTTQTNITVHVPIFTCSFDGMCSSTTQTNITVHVPIFTCSFDGMCSSTTQTNITVHVPIFTCSFDGMCSSTTQTNITVHVPIFTCSFDGMCIVFGPALPMNLFSNRMFANVPRAITSSLPLLEPYELNSLGVRLWNEKKTLFKTS